MSWGFCCPQRIHDYMHQQFWGIVAQGEEQLLKFSFMHLRVTHFTQLTSVWQIYPWNSLFILARACVYFISFIIILMPLTNVVAGAENRWEAVTILYLFPLSMKCSKHIWTRWWRCVCGGGGVTQCYASILNVNITKLALATLNITKLALAMFASPTNCQKLEGADDSDNII